MTATISLHSNWIKFSLESRYIFYNINEQVLTYHPPFPLSELPTFLNYYKFKTVPEKFYELLSGNKENIPIASSHTLLNQTQSNISNDTKAISESTFSERTIIQNISPITDEQVLSKISEILKKENNIASFVSQVFKMKYGIHPLYQYSNTDKSLSQTAMISLKDMALLMGKMKPNRVLAKLSVDKQIIKLLVPTLYEDINNKLFHPKKTLILKCQKESKKKRNKVVNMNQQINNDRNEIVVPPLQSSPINQLLIDDPAILNQYRNDFKYSPSQIVDILNSIPGHEIEYYNTKGNMNGIEYYHCQIESHVLDKVFSAINEDENKAKEIASQKYLKYLYKDMKYALLVDKVSRMKVLK